MGRTRRARRRATAATRWARRPARPRCGSSTRRSWSRTRASSATVLHARAARRSSTATRSSASSTGAGLFLRMELVKDKKTKEPLPRQVTERIFTECVRRGLLTMAYAASFRIQPALTIDEATAQERRRDPARGVRPRRARTALAVVSGAARGRRRAAAAARLARHAWRTSSPSGSAAATSRTRPGTPGTLGAIPLYLLVRPYGPVGGRRDGAGRDAGRHLGLGRRRAPPGHQGPADRLHRRGRGRPRHLDRRAADLARRWSSAACCSACSIRSSPGRRARAESAWAAARASCSTTSPPASWGAAVVLGGRALGWL